MDHCVTEYTKACCRCQPAPFDWTGGKECDYHTIASLFERLRGIIVKEEWAPTWTVGRRFPAVIFH